jgi:hypothetical protein
MNVRNRVFTEQPIVAHGRDTGRILGDDLIRRARRAAVQRRVAPGACNLSSSLPNSPPIARCALGERSRLARRSRSVRRASDRHTPRSLLSRMCSTSHPLADARTLDAPPENKIALGKRLTSRTERNETNEYRMKRVRALSIFGFVWCATTAERDIHVLLADVLHESRS